MNYRHFALWLPLLLLVLATGCRNASSGSGLLVNVDSTKLSVGIAGEVHRSPIHPVSRPGQQDWASMPGAHVRIDRQAGGGVGTAISDSTGKFFVELQAGNYTLTPQPFPGQMLPRPPEGQSVSVPEGGVAHVLFDYDTGIR